MLEKSFCGNFKRGIEHNYIEVEGADYNGDDYQFLMIKHNKIPGFLEFECKNNNGNIKFCYEVSSMQSLKRIYENNYIDYKGLLSIINGIYYSMKSIENYMLDENCIVLDPEYIFMNVESFEIKVLFYPYYKGNINNHFLELAEFFLDRIDHQNNQAVLLAYNIFKLIRTENFVIEELMEKIYEIEKTDDSQVKTVEQSGNALINDEDLFIESSDNQLEIMNHHERTAKKQNNILNKILGLKNKEKSKAFKLDKRDRKIVPGNEKEDIEKKKLLESIMNDEYQEYETINQADEEYGKTTLLLDEERAEECVNHMNQHSLTDISTNKIYYVDKFPSTIGKVRNLVDIVIDHPTISRMHACISEKDDRFYICDIGSMNGSLLNGMPVADDIELELGDEISLGSVRLIWK